MFSFSMPMLFSFWMPITILDLEFHLALQDGDEFIGGVREVFPALARRVGPEVAGEATGGPGSCNLLGVWCKHTVSF